MEKRNYKMGRELTEKQWKIIGPMLPEPTESAKGGQKPADNRACLEGMLWLLRSGARWKDIPDCYASGATCWRRFRQWEESGVLVDIWQKILGMLDEKGRIKWDEIFADGTFSPAKKGVPRSARPNAARVRSLWWWQMVRAYLSACSLLPRRPMK